MWRATSGAKRRPGVTKIRGGKRGLQKSYAKEPRCEPKNRHRRAWNKFLWSHIEYVPAEPPFPDFPVTTADAQTCAGCEIFPLSYCLVPAWYFKFVPATFAPYRGRYTPISSFKKGQGRRQAAAGRPAHGASPGCGGRGDAARTMGDELCSVCEEYIAEWFCRKCARNICQVPPARTPRGANTSKRRGRPPGAARAAHFRVHPCPPAALRARLCDASCAGGSRNATR